MNISNTSVLQNLLKCPTLMSTFLDYLSHQEQLMLAPVNKKCYAYVKEALLRGNVNELLHGASSRGLKKIVEFLVKSGTVNINKITTHGSTPLHVAAQKGHMAVVEILIKANIDLRAKDVLGMTALHRAAIGGHAEIMKMLRDAGMDLHEQDNSQNTSLRWAELKGYKGKIERILNPQTYYFKKAKQVAIMSLLAMATFSVYR